MLTLGVYPGTNSLSTFAHAFSVEGLGLSLPRAPPVCQFFDRDTLAWICASFAMCDLLGLSDQGLQVN